MANTYEKPKELGLHPGKTVRDHESGAWARREANKQARSAWCSTTHRGKVHEPFPVEVCNGRRTRALAAKHVCNRRAVPGQKGGGACRHKRNVAGSGISRKGA